LHKTENSYSQALLQIICKKEEYILRIEQPDKKKLHL